MNLNKERSQRSFSSILELNDYQQPWQPKVAENNISILNSKDDFFQGCQLDFFNPSDGQIEELSHGAIQTESGTASINITQTCKTNMEPIGVKLNERIFNFEDIKDYKDSLEVEYSCTLSTRSSQRQLAIVCKQTDCPFSYVFRERIEGEYNLIFQNNVHTCDFVWPEEDLILMRNRKRLNDCKPQLKQLMRSYFMEANKLQPPSFFANLLSEKQKLTLHQFYYGDVSNANDKRTLKKRFDNIFAQIKVKLASENKVIKQLVDEEKEKSQSKKKKVRQQSRSESPDGRREKQGNTRNENQILNTQPQVPKPASRQLSAHYRALEDFNTYVSRIAPYFVLRNAPSIPPSTEKREQ